MNILVTGSNGFFGKKIRKELNKFQEYEVFSFSRENSLNDLESFIPKIDFIFHFAGAPDPKMNEKLLKADNEIFTKTLVDILYKYDLKIPILFTSTLHAENKKSSYGKYKKNAEKIITAYSKKNKIRSYIFRLPHVFGMGSKPNHNSVITTWLYNGSRNKEIIVFDRAIKMQYTYVDDLIFQFINLIAQDNSKSSQFVLPNKIYQTNLGQIHDYIKEFKITPDNHMFNNSFKRKLFECYKFYKDYDK